MKVKAKESYRNAAGETIPGATTVLNELSKPALVKWANRLGLQGIDSDKYKDELADVGTLAHYFISCRLGEEVPDVSDYSQTQIGLAQGCYRKYIAWELRNKVKPILVEESFVSERYQYGGRPDLYGFSEGGFLLGDFKTNARGIYAEMIYQVAAYENLLAEQGFTVNKAVILRIGRSDPEGFDEKILTRAELDSGFEIFLRCLDIYRIKKNQPPVCTARLR